MNRPAAEVSKDAPLCRGWLGPRLVGPILLLVLAGCATPKKSSRPPASLAPQSVTTVLDLVGTAPAARVTLHTLIAPETSEPFLPVGRWWDEYSLTVANESPSVLIVDSAILFDVQEHRRRCGGDPDKLADTSRADWRAYQKAGVPVRPKIPELAGLKFVILAPFAAEFFGAAYGAGPYGFVLTPFVYVAALNDAAKVRREFAARQLRLPLRLEPGQSVSGSLSFPMTPGPLRFVLQCENDGQPVEIVVPLTVLSTLHLTKTPAPQPVVL